MLINTCEQLIKNILILFYASLIGQTPMGVLSTFHFKGSCFFPKGFGPLGFLEHLELKAQGKSF